jgi:hypothetical protein
MAKQHPEITQDLAAFIGRQKVFFVATAAEGTRINVSPKGLDAFRVLGPRRVCYLDRTGSGAETSAHLMADGRLTVLFCAFEGAPLILRLYGTGRSHVRGAPGYAALLAEAFGGEEPPGARQIVEQDVEIVQTSCGFGVPMFGYEGERPSLVRWAEAKGERGLEAYRAEKNARSMDGLPTGLVPAAAQPADA